MNTSVAVSHTTHIIISLPQPKNKKEKKGKPD